MNINTVIACHYSYEGFTDYMYTLLLFCFQIIMSTLFSAKVVWRNMHTKTLFRTKVPWLHLKVS